jgi:hypothetical protein
VSDPQCGAYFDRETGELYFYVPPQSRWVRLKAGFALWLIFTSAALARKFPKVFNRSGRMF